jgi:hypothetical protein
LISMRFARFILLLTSAVALLASCEKNTVSKIPHIELIGFFPDTAIKVNVDTAFIEFHLIDGDGDIGYGPNPNPGDTISRIYVKDSRYPSAGYTPYPFPAIDISVEDPKKGIDGKCLFYPVPQPVPRADSLHKATGDTMYYEFYIMDRAGDSSNHLTTHSLIIRP